MLSERDAIASVSLCSKIAFIFLLESEFLLKTFPSNVYFAIARYILTFPFLDYTEVIEVGRD